MLELDARLLRDFVQTPSSRGPSKIAGAGRTPDRSPRDPTRRPDAANGFENLGFDFSSQTLELRFRGAHPARLQEQCQNQIDETAGIE